MSAYLMELVTLIAIFSVAATVVAVLIEDAGFIHVGSAGIMGIGAYTAALLCTRVGLDPQLALLATIPAGALAGMILHLAVIRLNTDALALATLAVGIIVQGIMLNAVSFTGGPMGLAGIPPRLPWTGSEVVDALAFLGIVLAGVVIVRNGQFGTRVRAMRDDEELANDLELGPTFLRATIWIVSSIALSLTGGFLAFHLRYIDPSSFTVRESVGILAMALLVARPTNFNGSIGALLFIALPELLRFTGLPASIGAELRQLAFGAALLFVISHPEGPARRVLATSSARA